MIRARNPISSLVIAGFVAFAFSVAPVGLDDDFSLETKSAFAKGKGSGNSGGKGGSKRNSKSKSGSGDGFDVEEDGHSNGNGLGHEKAKGNGHNKDGALESAHDDEDHDNHGSLASALGNLNAAHASPTALKNANENSTVGLLAAYADAVNAALADPADPTDPDYDPEEDLATLVGQQKALGEISNKTDGEPVDENVVIEVNDLLSDYEPAPAE